MVVNTILLVRAMQTDVIRTIEKVLGNCAGDDINLEQKFWLSLCRDCHVTMASRVKRLIMTLLEELFGV